MKHIVRRKYTAFASSVVHSDVTCSQILTKVVQRVKQEIKNFSSNATASLLTEALKHFSWKTVHLEMRRNIPTLMSWLSAIVPARSNGVSALYPGSTTFEIKAPSIGYGKIKGGLSPPTSNFKLYSTCYLLL